MKRCGWGGAERVFKLERDDYLTVAALHRGDRILVSVCSPFLGTDSRQLLNAVAITSTSMRTSPQPHFHSAGYTRVLDRILDRTNLHCRAALRQTRDV